MKRLTHDLSNASEKSMAKERLDMLFSALWPRLEAEVAEAMQHPDAAATSGPQRSVEDMLAKVVDGIRRIQREVRPKAQILHQWGELTWSVKSETRL